MPIYEYECKECKHHSEHFLKVSDIKPLDCVACKASNSLIQQLSSNTSINLKGSGFHEPGWH